MDTKKIYRYRYIILFVMLGALCFLVPYTGDDWAWGSALGMERLSRRFDGYNGRYVGNLTELLITRSRIVKAIVMAFCLSGIVYLCEKITDRRWAFFSSCLLLAVVPRSILSQGILWAAGFANYTLSVFLILIYIAYIRDFLKKEIPDDAKCGNKPVHAVLLLVLGALASMVVEHVTIYNVLLGIAALVIIYARIKKLPLQNAAYCLGAVAGAVIMFSNSAYANVAADTDGYRTMALDGIAELIHRAKANFLDAIYCYAFRENMCLNLVLLCLCILIFAALKGREKKSLCNVQLACLVILIPYNIGAVFTFLQRRLHGRSFDPRIEAAASAAAALALIVFLLISAKQSGSLLRISFPIAGILCIVMPLFAVTPVTSRCFAPVYILFIVLTNETAAMLLKLKPAYEKYTGTAETLLLAAGAVCFAFYLFIYGSNYKVDQQRLEYVREKVECGETSIELLHCPHETYLRLPTPEGNNDLWERRYKVFYGIPQEISLIPVYSYSNGD